MTAIPPPGGTFRVVARRGDVWWGIQVRELDWVFSQARRLDEVVETARDAIAAYYDVPIAEVGEVIVDEVIDAEVAAASASTRRVAE